MRVSCLGAAVAARLILFASTLLVVPATILSAADTAVSGTVVDQSGQPLPRVHVRVIDSASREVASTFADEAGRFRATVPSGVCEVSASLTGFAPAVVP